jgi:exopolyphosphatase / guanosine-5'-triphosphate,3'-diphosphate pyrophosphatase
VTRVAAVDCGTNSLRLLIADVDGDRGTLSDVVRTTEIVRLGEGVDRTGSFASEALERTFAVLDRYAGQIQASGAEAVRVVATSAARDVSNRDAFVAGVRARLGVDPEVVSGDEEARLSYDGATRGLDTAAWEGAGVSQPVVVLDIGGGSTELVCRQGDSGPVAGQSLDVGSVRLTERYLHDDPPTSSQIGDAAAEVDRQLDTVTVCPERPGTLIGVAGTVTTVAAMAMRLPRYDRDAIHGEWIDADQIAAASDALLAMTVTERRALGFMAPGRADVIGGGALLLARVLRRLDVPRLLVSEHDILDAIAWSLA